MTFRIYLYFLLLFGVMVSGCQTNNFAAKSLEYQAILALDDEQLCSIAFTGNQVWEQNKTFERHVEEAKRRGLNCGVNEVPDTQISAKTKIREQLAAEGLESDLPQCSSSDFFHNCLASTVFENGDKYIGEWKNHEYDGNGIYIYSNGERYVGEFKKNKSSGYGTYNYKNGDIYVGEFRDGGKDGSGAYTFGPKSKYAGDKYVGDFKFDKYHGEGVYSFADGTKDVGEFRNGTLNGFAISYFADGTINKEGIWKDDKFQYAHKKTSNQGNVGSEISSEPSKSVPSTALTAAQREADELRKKLGALEAKQKQEQRAISNDTRVPLIDQLVANSSGKQGIISGRVRDNTGIAEVTVDGAVVQVRSDGRFEHRTFIPADGKWVLIEATDLAGLTSQKQLGLTRDTAIQSASISFDSLNPLGKRAVKNRDALALIVGVEGYKNTPAQAIYADSDAKMFRDYASEKLGIPENRIETLINDGAELTDMLLSVKEWLTRSVKQERTDVYVFFAGHGLASDDGEKMYLLPYDGSPRLLDRTAILRDELFSDIAAANPRSATVFLDTCYSGTTRGTDMLVASRPIAIRAKHQNIPDGFTVFTAAGGDQTAKPLEEAKHGMFSYFLMKGMEGDADSNSDNQITAAELHEYVEQNVVQQSGGSQVPELQGDAGRVLVRFQ